MSEIESAEELAERIQDLLEIGASEDGCEHLPDEQFLCAHCCKEIYARVVRADRRRVLEEALGEAEYIVSEIRRLNDLDAEEDPQPKLQQIEALQSAQDRIRALIEEVCK